MKYFRARPELNGGVAGGTSRAFVQLAKNFGANKGVTKERVKRGKGGGELQVALKSGYGVAN